MPDNNEIPAEIKPWVAGPNQGPRLVVQPCYIEPHAMDDLAVYHPGFVGGIELSMMHVAAQDNDGWYVKTEVDDEWHEDMMIAMDMLRLVPTTIKGRAALHDPNIASRKTPLMHGWKVMAWQVFKTRNSSQRVHQDIILWQKHDDSAKQALSLFSWRVYIDDAALSFAAKRAMNEGPFVLQQFIR